jgi:DNA (cytosine-5)-methyltransferase 1
MKYRLGSLFSGIGGFELGFEMTGAFETVFQVENNPYAQKILAKHWQKVPRFDDVRNVGKHNLPECDILIGGFPCQDVSHAGNRKGIDAGTRSGLWWEFHRIINELRPRVTVLENVPGLFTLGFDEVLGSLSKIGLDAEWEIISASSQGAPHVRERVFIVAYPNSSRRNDRRDCGSERPILSYKVRQSTQNHTVRHEWQRGLSPLRSIPNTASSRLERPERQELEGFGDGFTVGSQNVSDTESQRRNETRELHTRQGRQTQRAVDPDWGSETVMRENHWEVEPQLGRVADGIPARVDRLKCLGNAVVPQVAQFVALKVLESGILDGAG